MCEPTLFDRWTPEQEALRVSSVAAGVEPRLFGRRDNPPQGFTDGFLIRRNRYGAVGVAINQGSPYHDAYLRGVRARLAHIGSSVPSA